jgi:hypothetical protein
MSRTPGRRTSPSSPADTRLPSPAAFPGEARQGPGSLGWLERLELQRPALWGGARAGARCALAVGNPRCSTIALTPPAPFTYASTLRLPSQAWHANTSSAFRPAQQPGPSKPRLAPLLRLLHPPRRRAHSLHPRLYTRLREQKWPEFRSRSEDAVKSCEPGLFTTTGKSLALSLISM